VLNYAIVGGIPAKEIRKRFSEEIIEKLIELQWWNCPSIMLNKRILCLILYSSHNDLH
jgi:virginiamycin A acetyltransferase